jgi:hypothetical protein
MAYPVDQQADHVCPDPGFDRGLCMSGVSMPGATTQQGYGWDHQQERARWAKAIERAGGAECRADQCVHPTRWITAGEPWDLGHHPGQRGWRGPEHPACNRRQGAINSNRGGNPGARNPKPRRRRPRRDLIEVSVDPADL